MARVKGAKVADISWKKAKQRAEEMKIDIDTYIANVKKNGLTVGPKPAQATAVDKTPLSTVTKYVTKKGPKGDRTLVEQSFIVEGMVEYLKANGWKVTKK